MPCDWNSLHGRGLRAAVGVVFFSLTVAERNCRFGDFLSKFGGPTECDRTEINTLTSFYYIYSFIPDFKVLLFLCMSFFIAVSFCGDPFFGLFLCEPLESSSLRGIVGSNFSLVGDRIKPSNSKRHKTIHASINLYYYIYSSLPDPPVVLCK